MIAEISRPHGVRGAVRVYPTGPTLPLLRSGDPVQARLPGGALRTLHIESVGEGGPALVARFREVGTRDAAEELRGALLEVPEDRLPPPEEDEFYVRDLIGCRVTAGGRDLGTVVTVHQAPANDVLEVVPDPPGPVVLLPFTRDAIEHLDLAARSIRVRDDLLPDVWEPDPGHGSGEAG